MMYSILHVPTGQFLYRLDNYPLFMGAVYTQYEASACDSVVRIHVQSQEELVRLLLQRPHKLEFDFRYIVCVDASVLHEFALVPVEE